MKPRRRLLLLAALLAGVGLQGAGCGDDGGAVGRPRAKPLVEILSWWLAPGEAEALQALIHVHSTAYPDARIFNSAAVSALATMRIIGDRLTHGDPPDILQVNARQLREVVEQYPGKLESLDGLFDSLELARAVFPEAIADVSHGGHIMAMPVNMHRENALFYNKAIFAAHKLTPPTTVAELLQICRTLKAAGVTPLATANQGWILRMMLDSIAAGTMGIASFRDYFTGGSAAGLPQLREAVAVVAELLASYTNPDAGEPGFGWTNAAQALYNGDAAMMFHGDWAKGYFVQLGWRPGIDFGVVAAPGTAGLFLYLTDSFAVPKGAVNRSGAHDLLATVASPAGQVAFNALKGSSPIRADISAGALDPLGQATLDDLVKARIRMPAPNRSVYDEALQTFAADRDEEALFRTFVDNRPRGGAAAAR
jgi:glucose/mannose transport system substrate-binding protein